MGKTRSVKALRVGDIIYEELPDGTLKPLRSESDWARVDAMTDEQIEAAAASDADAQPLTNEEWANVEFVDPFKTSVTIRLDNDLVDWFKAQGPRGYQTKINAVLRRYVDAQAKAKLGRG